MDDTLPNDPFSAIPNYQKCMFYRKKFGLTSGSWHGDVFKLIFIIHDFYKNFSYVTLLGHGNPQTIVWRTQNVANRSSVLSNFTEISRLTYFDLLDKWWILNPCAYTDLDSMIGQLLVPKEKPYEEIPVNML